MIKVLLDTNFLMIPHNYKIDIFQEIERLIPEAHELTIPSNVLEEIDRVRDSGGRDGIAAEVALQLVKEKNIGEIQSHGRADEFIIDYAAENKPDVAVCTNDRELRKKLRELNVSVIVMRGRSRLDFY